MEYIWTRYGLSGFDEGGAIIGRFYLALAAGLFGSKRGSQRFFFSYLGGAAACSGAGKQPPDPRSPGFQHQGKPDAPLL